jgi:hypothetical protein
VFNKRNEITSSKITEEKYLMLPSVFGVTSSKSLIGTVKLMSCYDNPTEPPEQQVIQHAISAGTDGAPPPPPRPAAFSSKNSDLRH